MRFSIRSNWDDADHMQPGFGGQMPALSRPTSGFGPTSLPATVAFAPQAAATMVPVPATLANALVNGPLHMLDSQLAALVLRPELSASTLAISAKFGAVHTDASGHQYVAIDFAAKDGDGAALLHQLEEIGLKDGASFGNAAGGLLAVDKVASLLGVSDLAHASVSLSMHNTGTVDTQADQTMLVQAARLANAGIDGTGITIGVMSDSFNQTGNGNTAGDQASNDLPSGANLVISSDTNTGGEDEGRGMAQLVHDLAPGAKIVFADSGNSQASMAQHILDLMTAGCKVIVDDITYLGEAAYQDGPISQAVKTFTDAGGIYLTSAANQARNSFETTSVQLSGATVNTEQALKLTTGASNQQFLQVTVPNGANITFILQWDQPSASINAAHGVAKDLNLYGFNAAGTALFSAGSQDTTNNIGGDPVVGFAVSNSSGGDQIINLAVTLGAGATAADIHDFKIFGFKAGGGPLLFQASSLNTNSGTVFGHATSTAFSVGAVPYFATPYTELLAGYGDNPPYLEPFSSAGFGTIYFDTAGNRLALPIVRTGPQFSAVDAGNTTFFGGDDGDPDSLPNFYGTSAAAPDAAAIVVLMLQANPALTGADVLALLQDSSWDITRRASDDYATFTAINAGFDTDSGSGLINAQLAVTSAQTLTIQPTALQTQFRGTHLNDTFVFNNRVEQVDVLNPPFPATERFLKATDHVDGGAGTDTVTLNGDYATVPLTFTATTMVNVERLALNAGHSYTLTTADATIALGATLTVDGSALGAADVLNFSAAAETNGFVTALGGLGGDLFRFSATGFNASDVINGGTGAAIDSLLFTTAGTIAAGVFQQVTHLEQIYLANGTNSIALSDTLVSSADDAKVLTVTGGTGNDTINAVAVITTTNRVFFRSGAGNDTLTGGFSADTFFFAIADLTTADIVSGGTGNAIVDRLQFTTAGVIAPTLFQNVTHIEQILLANGTNTFTVPDALVTIADDSHILTVAGGTGNDTVDASAVVTVGNRLTIIAGAGNDTFTGGAGLDTFSFAAADLTSSDIVNGALGVDTLLFSTAGTVAAAAFTNVTHVETLTLANGTNSVALNNAMVAASDSAHVLVVNGGTGNDTIDASAVTTTTNRVFFVSGSGNDVLTGGLGGDVFNFAAVDLTTSDTVNGGTGALGDRLTFTTAGTVAAAAFTHVSHIETITLANGANNIALADAMVGSADDSHVLSVFGGTGADIISAAAVTTNTNRVFFNGGAGADTMTAGAGADSFAYALASESTTTTFDTIVGMNFAVDRFDTPGAVGTITLAEAPRAGVLNNASFTGDLTTAFSTLAGHHAGLFTANSGNLSGQTYLVVDLNGAIGYQSGADLLIHMTSPTGTLVAADFV